MFHIHAIFDEFDDGQQQIGIAQPTKNIIDSAQIFFFQGFGNPLGKRGQNHNGNMRMLGLNVFCHLKHLAVVHVRHANNQFITIGFQLVHGFLPGTYLSEKRRITKVERCILIENLFLYTTIVLQNKHIVARSYHENIIDALVHQFDERGITKLKLSDVVSLNN